MVTIKFLGQDIYLIADFTKKIHKDLVNLLEIEDKDLNFIAAESFFIHDGQEQTSYYINCEIDASNKYKNLMPNVIKYLQKKLKEIAINSLIRVKYFDEEHLSIDDDYPLYLTPANMVKAETSLLDGEDNPVDPQEEEESPFVKQINSLLEESENADDEKVDSLLGQFDSLFAKPKPHSHTCCEGDCCHDEEDE